MKKYNVGDVWLYDPDPENRYGLKKELLSDIGALSKRPVCVIRGTDDNTPYDTLLVVPGSSQNVPCIEFKKDVTSYTARKRMDQMKLKPYEIYPVHEDQLVQYFGRLDEDELAELMTSVMSYIEGAAVADICSKDSMEHWKHHQQYMLADKGRNAKNEAVISQCSGDKQNPFGLTLAQDEVILTPKDMAERLASMSFDVPPDFKTMQKICKSYCGGSKPNKATITMIRTVPLSDADEISTMSIKSVQAKYGISKSAAGAVTLLAADYLSNGNCFSWKTTGTTPKEMANTGNSENASVNEEDYTETIESIKAYLTDKSIRYVPNNILQKLLSVPEDVLKKHYVGTAFNLHYSELKKRTVN